MRVAVFGVGAVGARAARQLASTDGVDRVLIEDSAPERHARGSRHRSATVPLRHRRGPRWLRRGDSGRSARRPWCRCPPPAGVRGLGGVDVRCRRRRRRPARPRRRGAGRGAAPSWRGRASRPGSPACSPATPRPASTASTRSTWPRPVRAALPAPASTTPPSAARPSTGATAAGCGGGEARAASWCGSPSPSAPATATGPSYPMRCCSCPRSPASDGSRPAWRPTGATGSPRTCRCCVGPHPDGGLGAARVEVRGRRGRSRVIEILGAMDRPALAGGAVAAVVAVALAPGRAHRTGCVGVGVDRRPVAAAHRARPPRRQSRPLRRHVTAGPAGAGHHDDGGAAH